MYCSTVPLIFKRALFSTMKADDGFISQGKFGGWERVSHKQTNTQSRQKQHRTALLTEQYSRSCGFSESGEKSLKYKTCLHFHNHQYGDNTYEVRTINP